MTTNISLNTNDTRVTLTQVVSGSPFATSVSNAIEIVPGSKNIELGLASQGLQGIPGIDGLPGADGEQGPPGPPGPTTPSSDADNALALGADSLLYLGPDAYDEKGAAATAVSEHDIDAKHFTGTQEQDLTDAKAHAGVITGNPHSVTAANLSLGNVDNTSDADKPISDATQTALDGKSTTFADVDEIVSLARHGDTWIENGVPYTKHNDTWVQTGVLKGGASATSAESAGAYLPLYGFDTRPVLSFDEGTHTLSLVGDFSYYIASQVFEGADLSLTLDGSPPAAETYFISFTDSAGTLEASIEEWTFYGEDTRVPVAILEWNDALTPKHRLHPFYLDYTATQKEKAVAWYGRQLQIVNFSAESNDALNDDGYFNSEEGVFRFPGLEIDLGAHPQGDGVTPTYFTREMNTTTRKWEWRITAEPALYLYGLSYPPYLYANSNGGTISYGTSLNGVGADIYWLATPAGYETLQYQFTSFDYPSPQEFNILYLKNTGRDAIVPSYPIAECIGFVGRTKDGLPPYKVPKPSQTVYPAKTHGLTHRPGDADPIPGLLQNVVESDYNSTAITVANNNGMDFVYLTLPNTSIIRTNLFTLVTPMTLFMIPDMLQNQTLISTVECYLKSSNPGVLQLWIVKPASIGNTIWNCSFDPTADNGSIYMLPEPGLYCLTLSYQRVKSVPDGEVVDLIVNFDYVGEIY